MRDDKYDGDSAACRQRAARAKKRTVIMLATCLALMGLGVWQGDFGETLRNGTTL